jgi:uncharacterized protein YbbC (DUF1343 family)
VYFEPTFQKHAKTTCGGCQIHVKDRRSFEPVRAAVHLMAEFRLQNPERFPWREPPYEYEHEKQPIDILYGSDRLRVALNAGTDAAEIVDSWHADVEAFHETRRQYLLYA